MENLEKKKSPLLILLVNLACYFYKIKTGLVIVMVRASALGVGGSRLIRGCFNIKVKMIKMAPVANFIGAQHYKVSTGVGD